MSEATPRPEFDPYRPPDLEGLEVDAGLDVLMPCGRGLRLVARLVDYTVGVIALAIGGAIGAAIIGATSEDAKELGIALGLGVIALSPLPVVALNLYLLDVNAQTIGKKLVGVRIVRMDGSPPSLARLVWARTFPAWIVRWFFGPLSLLDPLLVFRDDERCLHDHMADTMVVSDRYVHRRGSVDA